MILENSFGSTTDNDRPTCNLKICNSKRVVAAVVQRLTADWRVPGSTPASPANVPLNKTPKDPQRAPVLTGWGHVSVKCCGHQ